MLVTAAHMTGLEYQDSWSHALLAIYASMSCYTASASGSAIETHMRSNHGARNKLAACTFGLQDPTADWGMLATPTRTAVTLCWNNSLDLFSHAPPQALLDWLSLNPRDKRQ